MSQLENNNTQLVCTFCSLKCYDKLHFTIHLRKCTDIIEKRKTIIKNFKAKEQCSYCKMYGHRSKAADTCCKIYKYYENTNILEQIKSYYGHEYYASHFE
jgi:hypothetical protein